MKKFQLIVLFSFFFVWANSQTDSLIFFNGNFMVGEIKSLDRNIIKIETDYSDHDFTIEWDGIKEIYTQTAFLITLSDGRRFNGTLQTSDSQTIKINTVTGDEIVCAQNDIVHMINIDQGFWNQLYASVDVGLDILKANNLRKFSVRSNAGYMANRWQLDGNYNNLISRQDQIDDTKRTEGAVTFKYFLPHDWYPMFSAEFLSNTEQQLKLRTTIKTGFGKYVIHTNESYWGFSLGASHNNENFYPDSIPGRSSWEGFLGTELNLFNTGDLNLLTTVIMYPSMTEKGRLRSDFKFDMKYDLPLDFYIRLGFSVNYDNQPAEGSSATDYVINSGFGWEW